MSIGNPLKTKKPVLMACGLGLACASGYLTAQAGYALHGVPMAFGFVLCTLGACFTPSEMVDAFRSRRWGSAFAATVITCLVMGGELFGEVMVMASARGENSQAEQLQATRYDDVRKNVKSLETRLALAQEKLAKQIEYGTPESYDAQIKNAEELAAREGSKDRGGCKAKCDAAKTKAAEFRAKQAIAHDRVANTEPQVADLTAQLAKARAEAKVTDKGFSVSNSQVGIFSKVSTMTLNPDGSAKEWTEIGVVIFMACLFAFGSAGMTFMAQQDWEAEKKQSTPKARPLYNFLVSKVTGKAPETAANVRNAPPRLVVMDARSAAMQMRDKGLCA